MKRNLFMAAVIGAAALSGGITAYAVSSHSTPQSTITPAQTTSSGTGNHFASYQQDNFPDLTYAAENAVRGVVNIEKIEEVAGANFGGGGYNPFLDLFGIPQGPQEQQRGAPQQRRSGGSGVIISPDGYIVTNNHVIEKASTLKVKLSDGRTFNAKLIGSDPTTDIALIKIEAQDLPTIPFGSSDALRLGEWVLAIGSPFDLQSTVTAGIVSAKARNLGVIPSNFSIESFIQTDAAVNPGNSGGALVNTKGQLVGVNTVIKSPTGSYTGYSFAVPVSIVEKIVMDLKEFGVVQRALLGVSLQPINEEFIEQMGKETGITELGGIYIAATDPEGAAHAAGVKKGDVITAVDGTKIDNTPQLQEMIAKHRPNDKVKISVKRDGQVKQFDIVLRNRAGKAELLKRDYVDSIEALGGEFTEISDKAKKSLGIKGGVQVVGVSPDGILSQARIRQGFVITHINDRPINSVGDLSKITAKITTIDGVMPDGKVRGYSLVPTK